LSDHVNVSRVFLGTNLAILIVLGIILNITGANRFITAEGLDIQTLLFFSAIIGFRGSLYFAVNQ